jgi:hypothetical protein
MNDRSSRKYSSEEVSRILRRALSREHEDLISIEELAETAREMGIDSVKLEAAIEQEEAGQSTRDARETWLKRKRSEFYAHMWSYIIVNTALLLIDIFTPGGWWFQWALLGWGIGLAFHFKDTFFPSEEQIEKGTRKMLARSGRRK